MALTVGHVFCDRSGRQSLESTSLCPDRVFGETEGLAVTLHVVDLVFYRGADGRLVEMRPERYGSEDDLQRLLAEHPYLLGGQSGRDFRLLLVAREQGVPGAENGADRWSLDHLFVDDEGVPTLVEVKRSTDTRVRREVVGQMLDYAANGVSYWPEGSLRRIIEFLNEQMDRTEVIGVEIQQYLGGEHATLVPRVLGRTTAAQRKKAVSGTYEEDLAVGDPAVRQAEQLLDTFASDRGLSTRMTRRAKQFLRGDEYLFQYYPMYGALEVPINRFRTAGLDDIASQLWVEFQALTSQTLSHKHLYVPAQDIVANWDALVAGPFQHLLSGLDRIGDPASE